MIGNSSLEEVNIKHQKESVFHVPANLIIVSTVFQKDVLKEIFIFSLSKFINTKVSELADEIKVKCEMAISLLTSPRIVFFDDSLSGINHSGKNEILKCLKRLNKEERTIVVLVSSSLKDIDKIINRLVVVDRGNIIYDGAYNDFKEIYCKDKIFEVFLNKNVSIEQVEGINVLEKGEYYYKLSFANKNGMLSKVINLFDVDNIVDLTIGNIDLNDIVEKINIIETILEQNPSISSSLKNPIYSSGTLNSSKYGISHSGITDEYNKCVKSYNDYFNIICEVAYYRTISKIIIDIISDNKAKETITNFISLNNVSFNNAEFLNPLLAEYDGVNFEAIKDLINQYIPLVSTTLNIYLTDNEQHKKIVEEFRKSLLYISNICQNRNKKENSNIAISSYIESL